MSFSKRLLPVAALLLLSAGVCCLVIFRSDSSGVARGIQTDEPVVPVSMASHSGTGVKSLNDLFAPGGGLFHDSTNVLTDAQAMNDKNVPSSGFRQGHVSPTTLSNYLTTTKDGFRIKMPSSTQIPSPAIYKGKIYVGGGFGSREFYCFDAKDGKLIWSVSLDDDGPSAPVIANDVVVFNTESCTIFALDAATGKMLWSWWLGDPLMSTPTIVGDRVFTSYPGNQSGHYNFNNGGPNQVPGQTEEQMVNVPQDELIPADKITPPENIKTNLKLQPTHVLAAFDLKSGKVIWQKWIDGDVMSAPIGHGEELLVTTFPGTVYRFSQQDGKILSANATRATCAPVMVNGNFLVSQRSDKNGGPASERLVTLNEKNEEKTLYNKEAKYLDGRFQEQSELKKESIHLDAGNGFSSGAPVSSGATYAWSNVGQSNVSSLQSYQGSRALAYKGRSYTIMGNELVVNDLKSGDKLWSRDIDGKLESGGFLATPPLVAGGIMVYGTLSGEVVLMNPETGKEIKKFSTGEGIRQQPVVEGGWIYVTTVNGSVIAINTGDAALTGWPVWGKDNAHTGIPSE